MTDRHVTYVLSRWGEPTQTFVRREAAQLVDAGYTVGAMSMKSPAPVDDPTPVLHLGARQVALGLLRQLLRHPARILATYWTILRHASGRNLGYHLVAATIGISWAGHVDHRSHLHAHFGWTTATATWALHRITGQTHSIVLHAFELHEAKLTDRFTGIPLREATQVFAISERDAAAVRARWDVDVSVLRMSVPREWITGPPAPGDRSPRSLLSVGSLVPKKGHDTLIESLLHLDDDWTVRIAGTGPEGPVLEALVDRLDLDRRVTFLGAIGEDTVRDELDRCRAFALACTVAADRNQDGIPVALMEAMARGVPVVSTRIGAIEELVEGAGLLADDRNPSALAEQISSLEDDQHWMQVARAGQRRVQEHFVPDVTLAPLLQVLRRTLAGPAPADRSSAAAASAPIPSHPDTRGEQT